MSRIPVIIPTRNEEASIENTLNRLECMPVEPIIILNDCTDNSKRVALEAGVTVLDSQEPGKVRAIQYGLRFLGRRALEPLLLLDADSRPLFSKWPQIMTNIMTQDGSEPCLVGGLVYFAENIDPVSGFVYTVKPMIDAHKNGEVHIRGANMAMRLGKSALLDELLDLPNFWPGEEVAMINLFNKHGGNARQIYSPRSTVLTDGSRLTSLKTRLLRGSQFTRQHFSDSYNDDASLGTIPYKNNGLQHLDK